jgi:hypothetical protein
MMGRSGFKCAEESKLRYKKKHYEAGLCIHCNEPTEEDQKICKTHIQKNRIRNRKAYVNKKVRVRK